MNQELRFRVDVPEELALESTAGVVEECRFGYRTRYQLIDGRYMDLPTDAARELDALGLAPGEWITVVKRQIKKGQRRVIAYVMTRNAPADQSADGLPGSIGQGDPLPGGGGASTSSIVCPEKQTPAVIPQVTIEHQAHGSAPAPPDATPRPCADDRSVLSADKAGHDGCPWPTVALDQRSPAEIAATLGEKVTSINGKPAEPSDLERKLQASIDQANGVAPETNGHAPVNGKPDAPLNGKVAGPKLDAATIAAIVRDTKLGRALKTAIAAAKGGEEFGAEIHYPVRFSTDEIVRLAITELIGSQQADRNGGRY